MLQQRPPNRELQYFIRTWTAIDSISNWFIVELWTLYWSAQSRPEFVRLMLSNNISHIVVTGGENSAVIYSDTIPQILMETFLDLSSISYMVYSCRNTTVVHELPFLDVPMRT